MSVNVSKRVFYILLLVAFSLFLFSIPSITSEDFVDITNITDMKRFLVYEPISGATLDESDLAPLKLTVNGNEVGFEFELIHKVDDFSLNYVFLPPGSSIQKASELLAAIPDVDMVAGYDRKAKKTVGYMTAFGGFGEDFVVHPLTIYEISVTKDTAFTFTVMKNG